MDGLERVHELLEELAEAVKNVWGDATTTKAWFTVEDDGYRSLSVERWAEDIALPVEAWKRRTLMQQYKLRGEEWSEDSSSRMNDYYKRHKTLLEEVAK